MGYSLAMLLTAATVTAGGLTASAFSLTQGQTDQAIAFGWPAIAVAFVVVMLLPTGRRRRSGPGGHRDQDERGVNQGP
ncbi:hypothetical protein AWH62_13550 [Maricaulis sp. W15]|uniref:hypothetical protein n=1 Tax=Maricaulis sp. W15 TaxID=1772333 RepID=UPI00094891D8|nr:hypothetical protein [Maricaulis sp. W15]OLF71077.1 hypothetical protein AWH62_13550 [Maricaulis sp. W15]